MPDGWDSNESPFHAGEQEVQSRMGVRDIDAWARKVVRPFLPEEHRAFHTSLPFLVAGARDEEGRPWATLLVGDEGFVASPDPRSLVIDAKPVPSDALENALSGDVPLGLLGIELATRRRNRVNGRVASSANGGLVFSVDQSFGNCPQYIREREWRRVSGVLPGQPLRGKRLTQSQIDWISAADTFFIASGHQGDQDNPIYGMDVSHRGGEPGFVEVISDTRIRFPDYAGNNHFNTLGNLVVDPRAGYLFVDFASGGLLQLTGRATIDWQSDAVAAIPGARRLVELEIEKIVELPSAVPLRWDATADSVRTLRLVEKIPESIDITSFVFEARDGGALPHFKAGQYLPIELDVPGVKSKVARTYSLSGAPSCERYRITVKREPFGIASRYLHDDLEVGAFINARNPAGEFILPCDQRPLVLASAGVGVTPLAAMLHSLAETDENLDRPIWFVHGARNGDHHALAAEIAELSDYRAEINLHIAYSKPLPNDCLGVDYHSAGRVDGALIRSFVAIPEAHYFLCGPTAFMSEAQSALEANGIPLEQIHTETFGPKG